MKFGMYNNTINEQKKAKEVEKSSECNNNNKEPISADVIIAALKTAIK